MIIQKYLLVRDTLFFKSFRPLSPIDTKYLIIDIIIPSVYVQECNFRSNKHVYGI